MIVAFYTEPKYPLGRHEPEEPRSIAAGYFGRSSRIHVRGMLNDAAAPHEYRLANRTHHVLLRDVCRLSQVIGDCQEPSEMSAGETGRVCAQPVFTSAEAGEHASKPRDPFMISVE